MPLRLLGYAGDMDKISVALGGGGAAGYGHIVVLEALDELGIKPVALAGTSMGALIAVAYGAGISAKDLRAHLLDMVESPMKPARRLWNGYLSTGLNVLRPVNALAAVETVLPDEVPEDLSNLAIPTTVVATDYFDRCEVSFTSGATRPRVAASLSIPGLFDPAEIDGRYYVDGGVTNNLPFEVLPEGTIRLAVDVASEPPEEVVDPPGSLAVTMGSMRIMMRALLEARLENTPPEILIEPEPCKFGALDFLSAAEILEAAEPAREATKRAVENALKAD